MLLVANWKMNITLDQAKVLGEFISRLPEAPNFIILPPAPYIAYLCNMLPNLSFGAQDISSKSGYGSHTGEISGEVIASTGAEFCLINHSEVKDSDSDAKIKILNCLETCLTPIICIGETIDIRKQNKTKEFIEFKIDQMLPKKADKIIIAYEPIWSIGSDIIPSVDELIDISSFIKKILSLNFSFRNYQIIYGGSVDNNNISILRNINTIDGVLIGRNSLSIERLNQLL